MKKKILIFILIIIFIILGYFTYSFIKTKQHAKILENEDSQVETLYNIYRDFLGSNNNNLKLDNTCFLNLVTGNELTNEHKEKLKSLEISNDDSDFSYTLYSDFNSNHNILTLTLIRTDNYEKRLQKYRLFFKNNQLKYETYDLGVGMFSSPSAE